MVSVPSRDRLPALALVALALLIVAGSAWFVYTDLRPDYSLSVSQASGDAPADAPVHAYADLDPAAQQAFDRARAHGGTYVVHHNPVWLDTFHLFDTTYVRHDGELYEVWAASDGLVGLSLVLALPAVGLAALLAGLGAWSYRRERAREPLTVLAALGAGTVAAFVWPLSGPLFVGALPIVPIAVAVAVVGAGSWVGLGRYGVA